MTTLQTMTTSYGHEEPPPPSYNKNAKSAHTVRLSAKQKQKSIKLQTQRWSCPKCTLLNMNHRNVCKACGYRRFPDTPRTPSTPNITNTTNQGPALAKRTSANRSIEIDQRELMKNDYDMFDNFDSGDSLKYIMYICCILSILSFIGLIVIMFIINIGNKSRIIKLLVISVGSIFFIAAACICMIRLALKQGNQTKGSKTTKGTRLPANSPSTEMIDSLPSFSIN